MNEVLKALKKRRGCRSYRPQQITDEELNAILKAGTYASTARSQQSSIIAAVQNPAVVKQPREMSVTVLGTPETNPFYGALTVLVVPAARDNTNRVYDGSCVMSNLMNAAKAVGLASCWVHRVKGVFGSEEGKALLQQRDVESDYEGIGRCTLGYRAGMAPAPAPRKKRYIYRARQGGKQVPRPGRGICCL